MHPDLLEEFNDALLARTSLTLQHCFVGVVKNDETYLTWLYLDGATTADGSLIRIVSSHTLQSQADYDRQQMETYLAELVGTTYDIAEAVLLSHAASLRTRSSAPLSVLPPSLMAMLHSTISERLPGFLDELRADDGGSSPIGATMLLIQSLNNAKLEPPLRLRNIERVYDTHTRISTVLYPNIGSQPAIEAIWQQVRQMIPQDRLHITISGSSGKSATFDTRLLDKVFTDTHVMRTLHAFYRKHRLFRSVVMRPTRSPVEGR